jgi:hypothetical protein
MLMRKSVIILIILFQICLPAKGQVNLQEGLVAHYPFNGNLRDKSGNGYDLTANGGEFSTGRFGNISAYKFNGTSDYLVTTKALELGLFSISFWVNLDEFPSNNQSQRCRFLGIDDQWFSINCQKDSVGIHVYDKWNFTNSRYRFLLHKWYHIVFIRTAENFLLYINDTLDSHAIDTSPFTTLYGGYFDGRLSLGAEQHPVINDGLTSYPDWASFFNGKIDDVRIYNRDLNEQEIYALYTMSKDVDPLIINDSQASICSGHPLILKANYDSSYVYQWLKDSTAINGATTDSLIINQEGVYRVKETTLYGNSDISEPKAVRDFSVFVRDTTVQCGSKVHLTANTNYTGTDSLIYSWSPAEGLNLTDIANPLVDIINTKTFFVAVRTQGGCYARDSLTVKIEPIVIYSNDTTIMCGTDAQLNITTDYTGNDILFYDWEPSANLNNSKIRNPIAFNPKHTVYDVQVSTVNGCVSSKSINVDTESDLSGFIFYPFNGNMKNQQGPWYDLIASGGRFSTDRFGYISAYEFNGTADYLESNEVYSFSPVSSLSFWINMQSFPLNDAEHKCLFVGLGGDKGPKSGIGVQCQKDSIIISDYASNIILLHSKYKLQLNKWYHVVVAASVSYFPDANHNYEYYGQCFSLYINDTLRSSGCRGTNCSGCRPNGYFGKIQLGGIKNSTETLRTNFFNGKIDDVRFYYRTLSTEDIHILYNSRISESLHPSVCMVSVNESGHNYVTWQKLPDSGIDSVYIYRESSPQNGRYDMIGKVLYSSSGIFIDSTSNAGLQSDGYKISLKDFCGYESEQSPPHKTIHLTMNKGVGFDWNLQWEPYSGIPVETYNIYRGSSKSDLTYIGSVPGSTTSFTDINAPSGTIYYQLRFDLPLECFNPDQPEFTGSRSNIVSNTDLKETDLILDDAIFYPNPADKILYIRRCNSDKALLNIYNLDGKLLLSKQLTNDGNTMDISVLNPGAYLVKLDDGGVSSRKILIKK